MGTERPITLLHLSDLQFGPHHRFEKASSTGSLLQRVRDDLARLRDEGVGRPDLVLLTGDLTEYGWKSQFQELLSFARGLTEITELEPRRIVIVPGNHDINWKLSEAYFAERAGNEEQPRPPYWPKLRSYAEFFARFYEGQPGLTFSEEEPWTLFAYPELRVVVAGLNSTMAESHRPEDHYGFLGEAQLRAFAGVLRPYKEQGYLRVAAVHHDLLDLGERDAARQDQKDLKGMLLPYLNLVVHGHLHEEQLRWLDRDVPALGIGSAGVKVPARPPEVPNQYQIVEVFADRVVYGTRAYVPDQKRFIGCLRSDPEGRAWRIERKVSFDHVDAAFSAPSGVTAPPVAELAKSVDAYRRHWAQAFRREPLFDLAAMGEDADLPAGLDLLHLFLPQSARRESPRLDMPRDLDDEVPARARRAATPERFVTVGPARRIDEVVTSPGDPWTLILGAPGAGKSTLTRWIVLRLCAPGESLDALPPELVPVRIELRRFDRQARTARDAGRSYDFFDYLDELHREHGLSLHGEPLRRLAEQGRLLWLFDGLDEVADPHARRDYAARIVGFRERYGERGVVTSRIVGARAVQPLFEHAGIGTYTLQELDEAQIETFLERWHHLAFPGAPEAAARRLERLRATLRESRPVRELCANPLLLTLIALLNRGAELPRRRHLVYERAVDLMAEQWETNKPLHTPGRVRFDLASKRRFLRQLAFEMMTTLPGGSGNALSSADLLAFAAAFCERELASPPEEARVLAGELIQHLRERNYILALLGGQTFGFVHKTFLEYLAAAEIQARFRAQSWGIDQVKTTFREHWEDPAWTETLTLLCGMLEEERPELVVELSQAVLETVDPTSAVAVEAAIAFVVRCLAELGTLDREPARTFARRLTDWVLSVELEFYFVDEVSPALRLIGPAWPEADRFMAAAIEARSQGFDEERTDRLMAYALAVCSRRERTRLIARLIEGERSVACISAALHAGQELGEWSNDEGDALRAAVEKVAAPVRRAAWSALVSAGVTTAAGRAAKALRASHEPSLRYRAARALLRLPEWRAEAVDVLVALLGEYEGADHEMLDDMRTLIDTVAESALREKVQSLIHAKGHGVRRLAAREIALAWQAPDAIAAWIEQLLEHGDVYSYDEDVNVPMLKGLASKDERARRALDEALRDPDGIKNTSTKILFAHSLALNGDERGLRILRDIASSDSVTIAELIGAAGALLDVPLLQHLFADTLIRTAHHPSFVQFAFHAIPWRFEDARDSAPVQEALLRIAEHPPNESVRFECLDLLVATPRHRVEALRIFRDLSTTAEDEPLRMRAATALRNAGCPESDWRPVLTRLSRSARRGSTRLLAAEALRDQARIAQIAARSRSARVRARAAASLDRLTLYDALLQVGRPRRGIVSLDGTRVGVIEELPHGSRFLYDREHLARPSAVPISPTLPLRPEPFEHRGGLHPFFENLLPEGWHLDQTCRRLGLDRTDAFGLLLATCADCAGAVEIVPERLPQTA